MPHVFNRAWDKHKNAQKFEWKTLATTLGYSMVNIAYIKDAFLERFELEACPVKAQSLPQKDKKRRKRKGQKKYYKNLKSLKT